MTSCERSRHRRKGARIEREIVERHKALGFDAERYPLSGASGFRGSGHDVDLYLLGCTPIRCEVKSRRRGGGFSTLERWLAQYEALFLRRDHADPLVVLPWRMWARLLDEVRPTEKSAPAKQLIAFSPQGEGPTPAPSTKISQAKNRTPKRRRSVCGPS